MSHIFWINVVCGVVDVGLGLHIVRGALNVRKEHKQWVQKFEHDVEMSHIESTLRGEERVCGTCAHIHIRMEVCAATIVDDCGCTSACLCTNDA